MLVEPEISAVSIVFLGSFNPKIFSPDWFARHDLITGLEADEAKVGLIHPDVTQFKTTNFSVGVESEKFVMSTSQVPYVRIKDLVVKVFGGLLIHTPLGQLGINRDVHVNLGDQRLRDKIGYTLAPPDAWGAWGKHILEPTKEARRHGGMLSVTMQDRNVTDRAAGYRQATVQPSRRIPKETGIFIQVNDHYELEEGKHATDASEMISYLDKNFDQSMRDAEFIIDEVVKLKDA